MNPPPVSSEEPKTAVMWESLGAPRSSQTPTGTPTYFGAQGLGSWAAKCQTCNELQHTLKAVLQSIELCVSIQGMKQARGGHQKPN